MSVEMVLLVVVVVFFVLLASETPVAFVLAASGGLGILLLRDADLLTATLGSAPFSSTANYTLAVIPMYMLLGMFALHGGLAVRLYELASISLRRLPGGLGLATVGACAGFAAVTGSSVATAATLGRLSVDEMRRYGYPASFAAGIIGAAGTLGALIPPSVVLVLYGVLAQESIGKLLAAGLVPGLLSAGIYAVYVGWRGRGITPPRGLIEELDIHHRELRAEVASRSASASSTAGEGQAELRAAGGAEAVTVDADGADAGRGSRWALRRAVVWIAGIFGFVLMGIYTGYFTAVESGALAALLAFVVLAVETRSLGDQRFLTRLVQALRETSGITAMAFAIYVGATILSTFLVLARVPMRFTDWVVSFDVPPLLVVVILLLALIPLGMALDTFSILVIVVPLVHPIVTALGFDGVWFAILVVKMIEVGLITPPVGINVFVVSGSSGVPVESVFRGAIPFIGLDLLTVALFIAFPALVLWLPNLIAT